MRRFRFLLSLFPVLVAGLVGADPSASAVSTRTPAAIVHPVGAADVVLRVRSDPNGWGGLYPDGGGVTLYGDGRIVYVPAGRDTDESGGTVVRVTEARVQEILRRARDAGLLAKTSYGEMLVTDQGSTRIEVKANHKTVVADVYALFFDEPKYGLTTKQAKMRKLLVAFVRHVIRPPGPPARLSPAASALA